jgi:hypothetical protein
MSLHYSAGELFILESSFGGGFDHPKLIRKHVALKATADINIPDLMERYGEWLVRTGKAAAALLVEHQFGKGYSDNIDGDGFIAWMAAHGKVEFLTNDVVKFAVEAYEGGDVRLSADDGVGDAWNRVMTDPAPRIEQVAWRETSERASPAEPEVAAPVHVTPVSINPAVKRSLDLGCDLATAVAAQIVEKQFASQPDWQDQKTYTVTAVREDGEEDRSRTIRIEIRQPAAYEGIYSVQMTRYVRKGIESFGFHSTRQRPSSVEENQLSLLVLSGSLQPFDVHNVYDIHSNVQSLTVYSGERDQFQELLSSKGDDSDVVRSKVTGELGLMVREAVDQYDLEEFVALTSYRKLREDMKVPVHILENWPPDEGAHVGVFVSWARLAELATIRWGAHCVEADMRNRLNALRP